MLGDELSDLAKAPRPRSPAAEADTLVQDADRGSQLYQAVAVPAPEELVVKAAPGIDLRVAGLAPQIVVVAHEPSFRHCSMISSSWATTASRSAR